jgi:hypothetical protein
MSDPVAEVVAEVFARYPEHEKLTAITPQSQAQGELLEWLAGKGVHLMVYYSTDEERTEPCTKCFHFTETAATLCGCRHCKGSHEVKRTVHEEGWLPYSRPVNNILAEYHGIDQAKLEAEKRAMLDELRASAERQVADQIRTMTRGADREPVHHYDDPEA